MLPTKTNSQSGFPKLLSPKGVIESWSAHSCAPQFAPESCSQSCSQSCSRNLLPKAGPGSCPRASCFPQPQSCSQSCSQKSFRKKLPKIIRNCYLKVLPEVPCKWAPKSCISSKQVVCKAVPKSCPKLSPKLFPKAAPKIVPQSCCPKRLPQSCDSSSLYHKMAPESCSPKLLLRAAPRSGL